MFHFLPVPGRLLEGSDDERGSSWHHLDGCLSVLDNKLHRHLQPLPVLGGLGNIIPYFLGTLGGKEREGEGERERERVRSFILAPLSLTKPRGPILGAREDVAPTSPPTALR